MSTRPLYLGPAERRAFAWLHAPQGTPRGQGVVLCPPLGYEAVLAHRALRHLAERLAARGCAVLRLDYHGTGDADGVDEAPGHVDRWLANIDDSIELLSSEGCGAIVLYGLRAGALLAAACAARRADRPVDALVLHGAPASGRAYVRELRALRRLAAASGLDDGTTQKLDPQAEEAAGFVLWGDVVQDLSTIDLGKMTPPASAALFLPREDLPGDEATARRWAELGASVERREVGGYAEMMQDPHKAQVPDRAWAAIADWVAARPAQAIPVRGGRGEGQLSAARTPRGSFSMTVRETPLRFGPEKRLFGVLTEPEQKPASRSTLLLLNAGSVHRIGSNRMHVRWARAWAARGHRVLRFDIGGLGDSTPPAGVRENQTYSQTAVADVEAAIEEARRHGGRVALLGLCSGAYAAFHTARLAEVDAAILINPQTFDYKEGDELDVGNRTANESSYYKRAAFSSEKWKKLVSGEVNVAHIARVFATRAAQVAATRLGNLGRALRDDAEAEGPLGRELRRVAGRTRLGFVFSEGDPGLDYLERHAGVALRRLRAERKISFVLVDKADHTFTPPDSQRRLFTVLSEQIDALT